jgi:hypothetical protein
LRPADSIHPGAMPKPTFELDPREVEDFIRPLPPRQQLVYRLAIRGLCARSRGNRAFMARTDALVAQFHKELPAVLREADALSAELKASLIPTSLSRIDFARFPLPAKTGYPVCT